MCLCCFLVFEVCLLVVVECIYGDYGCGDCEVGLYCDLLCVV